MKKDKFGDVLRALSFMSLVGSTMIVTLAAGFFCGRLVEERFAIYPFGRIIGLVLGVFMAIYTLSNYIKMNFIDSKDKDKEE